VNQELDAVDANPGDFTCDSDLLTPGAQISLRAAIQEANAISEASYPGPITINVPAGVYNLSIPINPTDKTIASGDLDITRPLRIVGAGPDKTRIDASGLDRVFEIDPDVGMVEICGLTMRKGVVPPKVLRHHDGDARVCWQIDGTAQGTVNFLAQQVLFGQMAFGVSDHVHQID
jgi:hypothetical protein